MIKFLVPIGIFVALLPQAVGAQACPPTGRTAELLDKDPIGHYTQEVVRRTNVGIEEAKSLEGAPAIAGLFDLNSLIMIESIFYMLVDTDLRAVEYSRDLTHISTCLHADLAILEAQIENVRCEVTAAYLARKYATLRELKVVANFVNQRYRHLVKGALDPQHVDRSWSAYHAFDPPFEGWCCVLDEMQCQIRDAESCTQVTQGEGGGYSFYPTRDACLTDSICVFSEEGETEPPYEDICPFDSNYLAYNSSGFGCSAELVDQFAGDEGAFGPEGFGNAIQAEVEAMQELQQERDEFLEDIDDIKTTTEQIDQLADGTILNDDERTQLQEFGTTASDDVRPRRVYGCNANLPPEDRENTDNVEGILTPGIKPSQEWAGIPLRGPFFFGVDHLGVWNKLLRLYHEYEVDRQFSNYFKNPDEFPDENDREEAVKRDNSAFGFLRALRGPARSSWTQFQTQQATQDAALLPKAQDMGLKVRDAMQPMRPAMKRAIELVNSSDGALRTFAINYAYFLRRTCIHRPCNERLETIMKVLFSDECFPYASGEFQEPDEDDPHWKKCQDAVDDL